MVLPFLIPQSPPVRDRIFVLVGWFIALTFSVAVSAAGAGLALRGAAGLTRLALRGLG